MYLPFYKEKGAYGALRQLGSSRSIILPFRVKEHTINLPFGTASVRMRECTQRRHVCAHRRAYRGGTLFSFFTLTFTQFLTRSANYHPQ